MTRGLRLLASASAAVTGAVTACACSVLLDWNGYTGGTAGLDGGLLDGEALDGSLDEDAAPGKDSAGGPPVLVDCGAGAVCSAAAPSGWNGPLALYEGALASVPACGAGYMSAPVFEGNAGLSAPPLTCSPCTCSDPSGGTCSDPLVSFYSDGQCQNPCGTSSALASAACVMTPSCGIAYQITATTPVGGACAHGGGGVAFRPPVTWSKRARACAPAATAQPGSCSAGLLCLPSPQTAFSPRFCVSQVGAVPSCPSPFTDGPRVYYGDPVNDARMCSDCTCGPPTGQACSVSSRPPPDGFPWLDTSCKIPGNAPLTSPNPCALVLAAKSFGFTAAPKLAVGQCAPDGGKATGDVAPTAPTTFCCTP